MAVIKNMMVRAGADFSAFVTQSKKASQAVKGMESGVSRSFNAIKKAASGIKGALGALGVAVSAAALVSAAKEAASAYDDLTESEIKLATVMRNTMNARNSDIQSILDLCDAQQKLGVVGADAQIAGAQAMAKYLSASSSLQTLIPVMNDMAAQQYGFNATAEQCTQIAATLGKVMNGQTSILSRYGYHFTEAEEAILKTGNEEERAATLAKIVTQNVGGMNHALAQTPSGRMQQLSNALSDVKAHFGEFVRTIGVMLLPLLWKLVEVLETVTAWANRAINSVAKFFGFASMLTGWQDIDTGIGNLSDDWEDLGDSVAGTGAAAEAAKRKMLGFDELNVLGSSGGGGGGSADGGSSGGGLGSAAGDGSGGLPGLLDGLGEGIGSDLPWLTNALDKIKEHLDLIKDLAFGVGAGFLTWKVLSGFGLPLKTTLGIVLAIAGAVVGVASGIRAWKEGVDRDNLIGMLSGAAAMVLGLGLAFGTTAAAIGLLVAGVGMLVVGIKDWITTGTLGTETFYLMEAGIVALGIGLALLTGSWIPLVAAAVAGVALAIYNYWDEICAWVSGAWETVSAWFADVWSSVTDWLSGAWQWVCAGFNTFLSSLSEIWALIRQGVIDTFSAVRDRIVSTAQTALDFLSKAWSRLKTTTIEVFTQIASTIQTCVSAAKSFITTNLQTAKDNAVASWNALKASCAEIFTNVKTTIVTMISDATSQLMSISWVNIGVDLMQGFLDGLRSMMSNIWNEVVNFITGVTDQVKSILGIASPSKAWEEIGTMLDAGLVKGLHAGIPDVLSETDDIASALEASINPQISASGGLAGGYEASVSTASGSDSETMEGILAIVMQMYDWLQTEGRTPHVTMIDGRVVFETVVDENNRAIRRTGASPIRG